MSLNIFKSYKVYIARSVSAGTRIARVLVSSLRFRQQLSVFLLETCQCCNSFPTAVRRLLLCIEAMCRAERLKCTCFSLCRSSRASQWHCAELCARWIPQHAVFGSVDFLSLSCIELAQHSNVVRHNLVCSAKLATITGHDDQSATAGRS